MFLFNFYNLLGIFFTVFLSLISGNLFYFHKITCGKNSLLIGKCFLGTPRSTKILMNVLSTGNVLSVCLDGGSCAKIPALRAGTQNPRGVLFGYSKEAVLGGPYCIVVVLKSLLAGNMRHIAKKFFSSE